uniref:Solute carrier family 23 member 2 n=1 Tax=Plectus sambesii TaxID=2011161 RepID=A0A914XI90_9BILA
MVADLICAEADESAKLKFIGTTLTMTGVATIMQTALGCRLPLLQGPSFAFIPPVIAMMKLEEMRCPAISATTFNATIEEGQEPWRTRMQIVQGGLIGASLIQMLLGLTGLVGVLVRYVGPLTIAPLMLLIEISVAKEVLRQMEMHWISLAALFSLALFLLYLPRVQVPFPYYDMKKKKIVITRAPLFGLFPFLMSIGLVWLLAVLLTVTFFNDDDIHARTDTKSSEIANAPWLRIPYPGQWGVPIFNFGVFLGMVGGTIASVVESVGDYQACARVCGERTPPSHAVNRGIFIEGVSCFVTGSRTENVFSSPEKSSTHYNYNDMIDLASSSGSSAKPSRSRGSTIDLVSSSGSSRNSSVPLGQCKSTTGTIDLMSRASTSSNEDVRVVELTGAKDGADEGSKRDLVIPEPYTPLIRRLSSLELKGKNLSAKQDLKSPRSFVGYEGLAWLLEENDDDRDLSWFATNGNLVALCKALKKNEAQKGTQSQSGRSVDHFESLMAEVASYAGGDTPTLLSLDAVSFLRASLCSSNGTFKPTRNVLRRVYNQICFPFSDSYTLAFGLVKQCEASAAYRLEQREPPPASGRRHRRASGRVGWLPVDDAWCTQVLQPICNDFNRCPLLTPKKSWPTTRRGPGPPRSLGNRSRTTWQAQGRRLGVRADLRGWPAPSCR